MTIRELAAGNPMIMDISIDIRENGKLKHIYRFGCGAEYYNSDPDLFKCKAIDEDPEDVKSMSRSIIQRSTFMIWSQCEIIIR